MNKRRLIGAHKRHEAQVYADPEVVELFTDEPELLAVVDALASSQRRHPHKRLAFALTAAALLLAATGSAVGLGVDLLNQQERFHASVPDDPQRLGPLVEITSGSNWALIAWRSSLGVCLDFATPGNSPYACGFPVRGAKPSTDTGGSGAPTHAVAGFVSARGLIGGDGKTAIFGIAAINVASVHVELRHGQPAEAPLYDAPPELEAKLRFFVVRLKLTHQNRTDKGPIRKLPPGDDPIRAYSAFDREGNLIERVAG